MFNEPYDVLKEIFRENQKSSLTEEDKYYISALRKALKLAVKEMSNDDVKIKCFAVLHHWPGNRYEWVSEEDYI